MSPVLSSRRADAHRTRRMMMGKTCIVTAAVVLGLAWQASAGPVQPVMVGEEILETEPVLRLDNLPDEEPLQVQPGQHLDDPQKHKPPKPDFENMTCVQEDINICLDWVKHLPPKKGSPYPGICRALRCFHGCEEDELSELDERTQDFHEKLQHMVEQGKCPDGPPGPKPPKPDFENMTCVQQDVDVCLDWVKHLPPKKGSPYPGICRALRCFHGCEEDELAELDEKTQDFHEKLQRMVKQGKCPDGPPGPKPPKPDFENMTCVQEDVDICLDWVKHLPPKEGSPYPGICRALRCFHGCEEDELAELDEKTQDFHEKLQRMVKQGKCPDGPPGPKPPKPDFENMTCVQEDVDICLDWVKHLPPKEGSPYPGICRALRCFHGCEEDELAELDERTQDFHEKLQRMVKEGKCPDVPPGPKPPKPDFENMTCVQKDVDICLDWVKHLPPKEGSPYPGVCRALRCFHGCEQDELSALDEKTQQFHEKLQRMVKEGKCPDGPPGPKPPKPDFENMTCVQEDVDVCLDWVKHLPPKEGSPYPGVCRALRCFHGCEKDELSALDEKTQQFHEKLQRMVKEGKCPDGPPGPKPPKPDFENMTCVQEDVDVCLDWVKHLPPKEGSPYPGVCRALRCFHECQEDELSELDEKTQDFHEKLQRMVKEGKCPDGPPGPKPPKPDFENMTCVQEDVDVCLDWVKHLPPKEGSPYPGICRALRCFHECGEDELSGLNEKTQDFHEKLQRMVKEGKCPDGPPGPKPPKPDFENMTCVQEDVDVCLDWVKHLPPKKGSPYPGVCRALRCFHECGEDELSKLNEGTRDFYEKLQRMVKLGKCPDGPPGTKPPKHRLEYPTEDSVKLGDEVLVSEPVLILDGTPDEALLRTGPQAPAEPSTPDIDSIKCIQEEVDACIESMGTTQPKDWMDFVCKTERCFHSCKKGDLQYFDEPLGYFYKQFQEMVEHGICPSKPTKPQPGPALSGVVCTDSGVEACVDRVKVLPPHTAICQAIECFSRCNEDDITELSEELRDFSDVVVDVHNSGACEGKITMWA